MPRLRFLDGIGAQKTNGRHDTLLEVFR